MGFLSFLPSILGVVGSLFKGKKAQYSTNQNPQQAQAYQMLLKQLMTRMRTGQQSPAQQAGQQGMNSINSIFYGPK
jgi:Tfp pilus assembly protein PilV